MAMANMNLIGVFVTKLWPVQALACGGGDGGGGDGGGATNGRTSRVWDFLLVMKSGCAGGRGFAPRPGQ